MLVDEVASGTDPVEGSALAQALVARLAGQARLTVVTTHYPELKEWASAEPVAVNAATALDPETNEPLYRITLGRPGTSHALQTAERLGLDACRRRRRAVAGRAGAAADRGASLRDGGCRASGGGVAGGGSVAARDVRAREVELAAEIDKVRASVERERATARAEAERELAEARDELASLRVELRAARRASSTPDVDRSLGAASERAARAEQALRTLDEPLPVLAPLAPGDPVEAPEVGVRGTIAAIDGDEAEVVGAGGHRVRIALARLRPSRVSAEPTEPAVRLTALARSDVSDELDVRGSRAQEAREAVRAFVDEASLAGLPSVRVIHGRGTGSVRAAVRDELDRHPLVDRRESEAQDGATLAHLGK